jgi:hypothetical protein
MGFLSRVFGRRSAVLPDASKTGARKPDEGAPLPLLLLVASRPEEGDLLGVLKVIDHFASMIGVYRCDIESPKWDPKRSLLAVNGNFSETKPDDIRRMARELWGPRCTEGRQVTIIEFLHNVSWLITITRPSTAVGSDHAGYRADLFPRRAEFFFNPIDRFVSRSHVEEFERSLLESLKKYRYDLPSSNLRVRTELGQFCFGIEVRSGRELNSVFSDLTTVVRQFKSAGLPGLAANGWSICAHGRHFYNKWDFEVDGKKLQTACLDCLSGAAKPHQAEKPVPAVQPGEEHFRRSVELGRLGEWRQAVEQLRKAANLNNQDAWSIVKALWCPRCQTKIPEPSPISMSDYAAFWRGVCPKCHAQLRFPVQ